MLQVTSPTRQACLATEAKTDTLEVLEQPVPLDHEGLLGTRGTLEQTDLQVLQEMPELREFRGELVLLVQQVK